MYVAASKLCHWKPQESWGQLTSGYHVLNLIAIDLQLYKILKIRRLSFFGTQCILLCSLAQ